jgi:hypothetical protein
VSFIFQITLVRRFSTNKGVYVSDSNRKLAIATFRFGLISEFVTGVRLVYGEKEKLIKDKISRRYDILATGSKGCTQSIEVIAAKAAHYQVH